MFDFFQPLIDFVISTKIPEQIEAIDAAGLFTNPWFLVPFIGIMGWLIFKQSFDSIILIALFFGVWAFWGTPYMQEVLSAGEPQIEKILPLLGGGVAIIGIVVYVIFFRSE